MIPEDIKQNIKNYDLEKLRRNAGEDVDAFLGDASEKLVQGSSQFDKVLTKTIALKKEINTFLDTVSVLRDNDFDTTKLTSIELDALSKDTDKNLTELKDEIRDVLLTSKDQITPIDTYNQVNNALNLINKIETPIQEEIKEQLKPKTLVSGLSMLKNLVSSLGKKPAGPG